jgi:hypothetical protein
MMTRLSAAGIVPIGAVRLATHTKAPAPERARRSYLNHESKPSWNSGLRAGVYQESPEIVLLDLTRFYRIHIVTPVWRVHVIRPEKAKQTEC